MKRILFLGLLVGVAAVAQQPRLDNAKLQTRSAAGGLEKEFRTLTASQEPPAWIGYAVPVVSGRHNSCCWSSGGACGCRLEGGGTMITGQAGGGTVKLEGSTHLLVLFRIEQRKVGKIRTFAEDCPLDAGGLPFTWLTDVRPPESVALLSGFAAGDDGSREGGRLSESALGAVALHADPAADRVLDQFTAVDRPERLRERAAFWLGVARGRHGYEVLRRMVESDPSDKVREKAVFALSQSPEPQAVGTMIAVARNDKSGHVRGQALFWLAQKAGRQAAGTITEAAERDPDTEVKKRAVFALSQLPKDEGVPLLIQVAKTNRDPAVRKQAFFWLGQSKDPRALAFFEETLEAAK